MGLRINKSRARLQLGRALELAQSGAPASRRSGLSARRGWPDFEDKTCLVVLGTALLATATDDTVDALTLKAGAGNKAYSARGLAHEVLVPWPPFEHDFDLRTTGREPLNNPAVLLLSSRGCYAAGSSTPRRPVSGGVSGGCPLPAGAGGCRGAGCVPAAPRRGEGRTPLRSTLEHSQRRPLHELRNACSHFLGRVLRAARGRRLSSPRRSTWYSTTSARRRSSTPPEAARRRPGLPQARPCRRGRGPGETGLVLGCSALRKGGFGCQLPARHDCRAGLSRRRGAAPLARAMGGDWRARHRVHAVHRHPDGRSVVEPASAASAAGSLSPNIVTRLTQLEVKSSSLALWGELVEPTADRQPAGTTASSRAPRLGRPAPAPRASPAARAPSAAPSRSRPCAPDSNQRS